MNLFAELMEFLPASGAINLPVGQQRAIWNRILSSVGAPIIPPVKFRARPFARPCDFISQGVTGLSRSNRSATIHDADRRSTNDEDTNEGEWVDNRFAAARNLSWTGHYADQRRASIGGVSFRARICWVIVCSSRYWIDSGELSGSWHSWSDEILQILRICS